MESKFTYFNGDMSLPEGIAKYTEILARNRGTDYELQLLTVNDVRIMIDWIKRLHGCEGPDESEDTRTYLDKINAILADRTEGALQIAELVQAEEL